MASRGRRYDGEPKLNVKKVLAVLIVLIVIIMCIVLIVKFATDDGNSETKIVANSYLSAYSGGKWGVINSKGETIIDTTYDDMIIIPDSTKAIFIYQSDVNLAENTYNSYAINEKGERLFTSYDWRFIFMKTEIVVITVSFLYLLKIDINNTIANNNIKKNIIFLRLLVKYILEYFK